MFSKNIETIYLSKNENYMFLFSISWFNIFDNLYVYVFF